MPTFAVQENWEAGGSIIDHWRALQLDHVTRQFALRKKKDLIEHFLTHRMEPISNDAGANSNDAGANSTKK